MRVWDHTWPIYRVHMRWVYLGVPNNIRFSADSLICDTSASLKFFFSCGKVRIDYVKPTHFIFPSQGPETVENPHFRCVHMTQGLEPSILMYSKSDIICLAITSLCFQFSRHHSSWCGLWVWNCNNFYVSRRFQVHGNHIGMWTLICWVLCPVSKFVKIKRTPCVPTSYLGSESF